MEANVLPANERSRPDSVDVDAGLKADIGDDIPRLSGVAALSSLILEVPGRRAFRTPQAKNNTRRRQGIPYIPSSQRLIRYIRPKADLPPPTRERAQVLGTATPDIKPPSNDQQQAEQQDISLSTLDGSNIAYDRIEKPSSLGNIDSTLPAIRDLSQRNPSPSGLPTPEPPRQDSSQVPVAESIRIETITESIDRPQQGNAPAHENLDTNDQSKRNGKLPVQVQVPLSKLETARRLTFTTSDTVVAENIVASRKDNERLRSFVDFLVPSKHQHALFGKQLPLFAVTLVSINAYRTPGHASLPNTSRSYICIHGPLSDAEILEVHTILSKKANRQWYHPWGLCYKQTTLTLAAAPFQHEGRRLYSAKIDSRIETLCGAQLQSLEDNISWLSTIGGLVEIDGQYFAITTSHKPGGTSTTNQGPHASEPMHADPLYNVDFDDDIEPALVLRGGLNDAGTSQESGRDVPETSGGTSQISISNIPTYMSPHQPGEHYGRPDLPESANRDFPGSHQKPWYSIETSDRTVHGLEWDLIPVQEKYHFPNILLEDNTIEGRDGNGPVHTGPLFALRCSSVLKETYVHVKSGRSGLLRGTLLPNPSFLALPGHDATLEVWVVRLDNSKDLQIGDSGSWVFDSNNGTVFGSIIAISLGYGYLIPLRIQFDEIQQHGVGTRPTLPSPADVYFRLSQYYLMINPELSHIYESKSHALRSSMPEEAQWRPYIIIHRKEKGISLIPRNKYWEIFLELMRLDFSPIMRSTIVIMVPSMLCSGCLAGYSAGYVLNLLEPALSNDSLNTGYLDLPKIGLLAGLVSVAVLLLQIPMGIWLAFRYHQVNYGPFTPRSIIQYVRDIWKVIWGGRNVREGRLTWYQRLFTIIFWYICSVLRYLLCLVLIRNTIPGIAKQAHTLFMVESTLAILTLSFSSLMPALQLLWIHITFQPGSFNPFSRKLRYRVLIKSSTILLTATIVAAGLDAACACIIADIAHKLGIFSISPKSLAAATAVFSIINSLWPLVAFIALHIVYPVYFLSRSIRRHLFNPMSDTQSDHADQEYPDNVTNQQSVFAWNPV